MGHDEEEKMRAAGNAYGREIGEALNRAEDESVGDELTAAWREGFSLAFEAQRGRKPTTKELGEYYVKWKDKEVRSDLNAWLKRR